MFDNQNHQSKPPPQRYPPVLINKGGITTAGKKFVRSASKNPIELGVLCSINHTHPTGPKLGEDFVVGYGFADHRCIESGFRGNVGNQLFIRWGLTDFEHQRPFNQEVGQ